MSGEEERDDPWRGTDAPTRRERIKDYALDKTPQKLRNPSALQVRFRTGFIYVTVSVLCLVISDWTTLVLLAATAGICGFTLPSRDLSDAVRLWRFLLTALGGIAGLFGLTVGAILLLVHLAGLTSLGVAYLAPFSDVRGWRAVLRPRLSRQKFRDPALGAVDRKNQR